MATIRIDDESVSIVLSAMEKVQALRGSITVPRSAIIEAHVVPDGMNEVHGVRAPGAALPGVMKVGIWRSAGLSILALCHGHAPAIVMELAGQVYDRTVVTVEDPDAVRAALQES